MPEKILENVLNGQLDLQLLLTWLQGDNLEEVGEDCLLRRSSRNEFTAYFLSFLRAETDSIVENDSGARAVIGAGTPERSDGRAHRRAASDPTAESPARPHHSPNREKKRSGRKVKTKLFTEDRSKDLSSDDVRITAGIDRMALASSTPLKNDSVFTSPRGEWSRSPMPTPPLRDRRERHEHTLGDYLVTPNNSAGSSRGKKKRNSRTSDDSREETSIEATHANISGRKSTSLRSEKRRIKPTNIDLSKKSISLTSFHNEFQKVGCLALENNEVFSAPPQLHGESFPGSPGGGFAAERDALRRERHRLLEKFTSLSAASSPKCTTPLIKISQEEDYILPDVTKVTYEDSIQVLVNVYQVLLDSNLALCYTSELCFLLALLRGRQKSDANISITEPIHVLRSVHNACCFAARTLRTQRVILSALLDRPSLRALAEARSTKAMAPDLSKSLLDVYGVRGETAQAEGSLAAPGGSGGGGAGQAGHVVAWNAETDGQDNFPSTLSFHSFKKQRDMFYEIVRWYEETGGSSGNANVAGPSLRTRVRALLAAGATGGQANYAHLGVLVARHAIATVSGGVGVAESRLSKLQRRLTRPPAHQTNTIFTQEEQLYRELLSCSENEPFRVAVRDALATELIALDAAPVHTGAALVSVHRRLATLAKLLGLLAALPYCPQHQPVTSRRTLPYILALRSYAVPSLDIYGLLLSSIHSGRTSVSVPWACGYLCALAACDAHALRLPHYLKILRLLRTIYRRLIPLLPARTALYLRCTISSLFAQNNIPQELLYEDESDEEEYLPANISGLDAADIISETELAALLGARKEVAALLSEGLGPSTGGTAGGGPRHVTPLRVGPSPNRATQRHTLIQKRLEEAVVRGSGGAGARRVLELVCERVAASALTNCTRALALHRHKVAGCDVSDISRQGGDIRRQLEAALGALLSERGGRAALCALAERAVRARLARHTRDTGELCEAASLALRTLVSSPWSEQVPTAAPTPPTAAPTSPTAAPTSPTALTKATVPTNLEKDLATALIDLKECICLVVEHNPPSVPILCSALEAVTSAGSKQSRAIKRAAVQLSQELCLALACSKPEALTDTLLRSVELVWSSCVPRISAPTLPTDPPMREGGGGDSRAPTPVSEDEGPPRPPPKIVIVAPTVVNDKGPETDQDDLTDTFARLISPRVIKQVSVCGPASWDALRLLVMWATERGWLCPNKLTESCVALYRRDWPQEVLSPLSAWLRTVGDGICNIPGGRGDPQLALFLGFLGEYCDDLVVPDE